MKAGQASITNNNLWTIPWESTVALDPETIRRRAAAIPEFAPDPDDVEAYRRDGAVRVAGAFADWVDHLRRGLERNLADPQAYAFPCESTAAGEAGRYFDSYCNWQLIPEYLDFVLESSAASMAGRFMGSQSAQFFHEHVFLKEPGTQHATPWHQDLPYYCVDGTQTASIYVALDAIPEDVAVRYVAGSHRWGKLFHPRVFLDGAAFNTEDPDFEPVPDIDGAPGEYRVVSWALEPGDAVVFDFRTLHGTGTGAVGSRRRAFSTRWLGDDVVYCRRAGETSPPYPEIGLVPGERLREDWFPVLWRRPG